LSQIVVAVAIILIMIFRRQGLLGETELRLPLLFKSPPWV
jgi:ABC-type branched-subunit amino acid transport system permease subunit